MNTDFFDRETHAKKQTRQLVWLFGLAVLFVVIVSNLFLDSIIFILIPPSAKIVEMGVYGIVETTFYLFGEALMHPWHFLELIARPLVVILVSLGTLLSIVGGSYFKMRQLSAGGSVIARLLGGRRIEAGTTDTDELRLRNVIEEMAVASGTSVPEIYVLDTERGINSFAAGYTRDDVAIGVTRGCLKLLTRDELQGMVAHEFSHILNGDTRLNMKLIGLAHGLFWPTLLGRVLCYGGVDAVASDDFIFEEDTQTRILPTAVIGVVFVLIGCVSLPFVRLLKSAICRQRKWLADASAVQFTRNPAGIEGALKKIGGLFKHGRLDSPNAELASHLYFANSDYDPWLEILATHPPLKARILAIDPAFDGQFPKVKMLSPNQQERNQLFDNAVGQMMTVERNMAGGFSNQIGALTAEHLRHAALMRLNLPPEIANALRMTDGASTIVYSLLLSEDDDVRGKQLSILQAHLTPDAWSQTQLLAPKVLALGAHYKLALAELAVPALRQNNLSEHDAFHQNLQRLIECDGYIALFEYTLMKMVDRQLHAHFTGPQTAAPMPGRIRDLLPECTLLLSALAHVGSDNEAEARKAFAIGTKFLDAPGAVLQFLTRNEWDLAKVDAALTKLATYHDPLKRNVLLACAKTVTANQQVNDREAELLRAIADALGCPMPPFVEAIQMQELANAPDQTT